MITKPNDYDKENYTGHKTCGTRQYPFSYSISSLVQIEKCEPRGGFAFSLRLLPI